MKISYTLQRQSTRPLVLAIGFFDGMHRGHREIARQTLRLRRPGWRSGVLTFANHPATYLRPGTEPPLITTAEERIGLLAGSGFDECYFVRFDASIALQEAQTFLRRTLIDALAVRGVVVGETFRFGHGRAGDTALMKQAFDEAGLLFAAVEQVRDESGARISSTRIRQSIAQGEMQAADEMLGHAFELRGVVAQGEGRGHGLEFPTANVTIPLKVLPKDGIYSGVARHDGRDYAALISIGTNPTFDGRVRTIEAWLRDFHDTIYGHELALRDLRFVRDQERYESVDALVARMREDARAVKYPAYG